MANIVTWTHPTYQHTTTHHAQEVKTFHAKMLEVGMISVPPTDYIGTIDGYIDSRFAVTLGATVKEHKIIELVYDMPVGDGSIQFEDIPDTPYKKIIRESYDSTPCRLGFEFFYEKTSSNSSYNVTHINYRVLSARINYYDVDNINKISVFTSKQYKLGISTSYNISTLNPAVVYSSNSYICLTGGVLYIAFMNLKYGGIISSSSTYNSFFSNDTTHLILCTISRSDGCVNIMNPAFDSLAANDGMSTSNTVATSIMKPNISEYIPLSTPITGTDLDNKYMQSGFQDADYANVNSYGAYNVMPTYMDINRFIKLNPAYFRTSLKVGLTNTESTMYVVMKYRGQENVRMRYLNYGAFTYHFKSPLYTNGNLFGTLAYRECDYIFLYDEHECTTDSVILVGE